MNPSQTLRAVKGTGKDLPKSDTAASTRLTPGEAARVTFTETYQLLELISEGGMGEAFRRLNVFRPFPYQSRSD